MSQIIQNLQALCDAGKITQADFDGLKQLPEALLESFYESQFKQMYDEVEVELTYEKKKKDCWFDEFNIDDTEKSNTELAEVLQQLLPTSQFFTGNKSVENSDGEKVKTPYVGFDEPTTAYIIGLINKDRAEFEEKWAEEHKPSIKKNIKKSGEKKTREEFKGEIRYKEAGEVGSKELPEGHDNEYFFEGDEEEMICKATFVAKDKSYKNMSYKSIKAKNYMGGDESQEDDGGCCGAVIWDRATGSKAVKKTGISPAKFRIRCSNKAIKDGKCKGCMKNPNFFTDTYTIGGKANGKQHHGTTYKDFIVNNLKYA